MLDLFRDAAASNSPLCRHCRLRKICRPRGLCWPCYGSPEIQAIYPASSACQGRTGWRRDFCGTPKLPEPTQAAPGSEEKIAVLTERARQGLALHHPDDYRPQ